MMSFTRRALLLGGFLFLGITLFGFSDGKDGVGQRNGQFVRLVIDYGNGVEKHYTVIPWKADMTLLDAMNHAKGLKPALVFKIEQAGGAETAFIKEIDDFKNEGGGSNKKNWLFGVNESLADRGVGVYKLNPSDTVVWRFDKGKPE